MLETFLQYRKKLNILIIFGLTSSRYLLPCLPAQFSWDWEDCVQAGGPVSGVITSKFISLRDYQVPIRPGSKWARDGLEMARAAEHQDKWPALRATHINANLGCLDYHTQWSDQSCSTSLIWTECE